MAVCIRLTRFGTKKRPHYRIVATDSRYPQGGRHLEILGTYDPMNLGVAKDSPEKKEKGRVHLKTDRVQYWVGVGARLTDSVQNILKREKISLKKSA